MDSNICFMCDRWCTDGWCCEDCECLIVNSAENKEKDE